MLRAKKIADLVDWVNTTLDEDHTDLGGLRSGISLVQLFHILYPQKVKLTRLKYADGLHNWQQNFKLLQQILRENKIDHHFDLNQVLDKKKHDLFTLATWVRGHYTQTTGAEHVVEGYDAKAVRDKARLGAERILRGKCSIGAPPGEFDNLSETSGSTVGSSCISGRSSSTNYLSSYNKNRLAKNPVGAAKPLHAHTKASASKTLFAIPTPAAHRRPPTAQTPIEAKPSESFEEAEKDVVAVSTAGVVAVLCVAVCGGGVARERQKFLRRVSAKKMNMHNGLNYRQRQRNRPSQVSSAVPKRGLQSGDFIPRQGLLPAGFNFLDPSTWSGEAESTAMRVQGWDALVNDSLLEQLAGPARLSPSVYAHAGHPLTPATLLGTPCIRYVSMDDAKFHHTAHLTETT